MSIINGGGEGTRTPVRKITGMNRYMLSLSFDLIFPTAARQANEKTRTFVSLSGRFLLRASTLAAQLRTGTLRSRVAALIRQRLRKNNLLQLLFYRMINEANRYPRHAVTMSFTFRRKPVHPHFFFKEQNMCFILYKTEQRWIFPVFL